MPFAQKPSIFPSSSALAAIRPNDALWPTATRHRADLHVAVRIDAGAFSICFSPSTGPGAAPMRRPFDELQDRPSLRREISCSDQKPVHVLRERAQQLAALPVLERIQRRVRGAADEVEPALAQLLVGLGHRVEELERGVEALLPEAASSTAAIAGKYEGEIRSGIATRRFIAA